MAITRSQADFTLLRRAGQKMVLVGLDGETTGGTNVDLIDPLADALQKMGYSVSAFGSVSDEDLSQVPSAGVGELLDRAELRLLQTISGNLVLVDTSIGPRRESLGQIATQLKEQIAALETRIARDYGSGTFGVGVINLGFAEDGSNEY